MADDRTDDEVLASAIDNYITKTIPDAPDDVKTVVKKRLASYLGQEYRFQRSAPPTLLVAAGVAGLCDPWIEYFPDYE